jgi:hypothetical protein
LNQGDLRNQAVNVRLAMVNGEGVATVNGQHRGRYKRAKPVSPQPTMERMQRRAPPRTTAIRPKPTLVRINPRILNASAPVVLPQLPDVLDARQVNEQYAFDFATEVDLLNEEGFCVRLGSDGSSAPPSPIPSEMWARPS